MRKFLTVLVALVLALSATAFAAVPSITNENLITVSMDSEAGLSIFVVVPTPAEAQDALADMVEYVNAEGNSVQDFFGADVKADLEAVLGSDIEMNEFCSIGATIPGGVYEGDDVNVTFDCATDFAGKDMACVVGEGEKVDGKIVWDWTVLDCEANDEGAAVVNFPEDTINEVLNAPVTVMGLLNN